MPRTQPTTQDRGRRPPARQAFPDELRGIALLGIVVVNAPFLMISGGGLLDEASYPWYDGVAEVLVAAFAQGKSYLLFAFLFGYGAALMLRVDRGPADPAAVTRYRRRLVGLGLVGVLHAVLLFVGDILVPYAIIGILVPWLARQTDRRLIRMAAAGWAIAFTVLVLLVLAVAAEPGVGLVSAAQADFDRTIADGTLLEAIGARVAFYPDAAVTLGVLNWPLILACFCVGLVAGRRNLLAAPSTWAGHPTTRRISRLALLVGLPCAVLAGLLQTGIVGSGTTGDIAGVALSFATAPLLSAGYVVWLGRRSGRTPLVWTTAAGRQSLTCYVAESAALVLLASEWGFGLFGDLGPAAVLGISIGVWAFLEVLARTWAATFRQGPLEWLLRWWTYGARPALRRA